MGRADAMHKFMSKQQRRKAAAAAAAARDDLSSLLCLVILILLALLTLLLLRFHSPSAYALTFHSTTTSSACNEQFDVVYTWVNGSDADFIRLLEEHAPDAFTPNRFRDHDELKYSLRSLAKFAPWVRKVYLVTNGQKPPSWLNTTRVTVVTHREFFKDKSHLPTFSSPAIEANLHYIPGLSNRFLYFNDDVFLGAPVFPDDFVETNSGRQRIYLSWEIPPCAEGCADAFLGDRYCDLACNVSQCDFDLGDCLHYSPRPGTEEEEENEDEEEERDGEKGETCGTDGCLLRWVGDGICDASCRELDCGFDAGDCQRNVTALLPTFDSNQVIQLPIHGSTSFLIKFDGEAVSPQHASLVQNQSTANVGVIKLIKPVEKWDGLLFLLHRPPAPTPTTSMAGNFSIRVKHLEWKTYVLQFDASLPPADQEGEDGEQHAGPDSASSVSMDSFAQSLVYSKQRLRQYFKLPKEINSKVPAHMPHLIDRSVMERLQAALAEDFAATSARKFRDAKDLQFSYTYFTYLMSEQDETLPAPELVWSLVDTDEDGCLNLDEFRTLLAMVLEEDPFFLGGSGEKDLFAEEEGEEGGALQAPAIDAKLLLLAHEEIWRHMSFTLPLLPECLSLAVLLRAERAFAAAQKTALATIIRTRSRYEIVEDSSRYVTFVRLGDNVKQVLKTLDGIRAKPTKFICINDDTSARLSATRAKRVDKALQAFFQATFPKRSEFEWEDGSMSSSRESPGVGQIEIVSWPWRAAVVIIIVLLALAIRRGAMRHSKQL